MAVSTAAASSFKPKLYANIAATDPMAPSGLARWAKIRGYTAAYKYRFYRSLYCGGFLFQIETVRQHRRY